MTNALVLKASSLINSGDIAGAEYALVSLAESDGDHALVAVLDEMAPKDLLAVIREFDASKESVVNLLVTPQQFARAVIMEKLYDDRTHAHLRGMINSVIFRDRDQTVDFIAALGDIDGGCEALVDYLSDRDEEVLHFQKFETFNVNLDEERDAVERGEISDGDWKELTWLLKHEHPDMFEQIWPKLKIQMQRRLQHEAMLQLLEEQSMAMPEIDDDEVDSVKPMTHPRNAPAQPPGLGGSSKNSDGLTDSGDESAL